MTQSYILEGSVKLSAALGESPEIGALFAGLRSLPFFARIDAFGSMAKQMCGEGQDGKLVKAVFALA